MLKNEFIFNADTCNSIMLYGSLTGFGFLTEENKSNDKLLSLPELNNGFEPWYWYNGQNLTKLAIDEYGIYIDSDMLLPLTFKADVESVGNYKIKICINAADTPITNLMAFSGRRRLILNNKNLKPYESFTFETTVNVCDFIPRGQEEIFSNNSVCITLVGKGIHLSKITIEKIDVPTIYIAGDSTLTDQTGAYPYIPENCYCGWAQFLTFFLNNNIAVSNHAHSGLTTESFRNEGHYSIVEKYIKENDYFILQFGHNDQKLSHLTANGGYRDNVIRYINEIRKKGATVILVTPLCRNSWRGSDGAYNDLLSEYDHEIKKIGEEMNVDILNLHDLSHEFITKLGLEASKSYFFPNDFTHTNDYGAYKMASFIAGELKKLTYMKAYVKEGCPQWLPPHKISLAKPPKDCKNISFSASETDLHIEFDDISDCIAKDAIISLASYGIISDSSKAFRPNDLITRVEILSMLIKLAGFFPTNVYNDYFEDVIGHEWYAGVVECAWSNGLISGEMIEENNGKLLFRPLQPVTYEELILLCINTYKSRKSLPTDLAKKPLKADYKCFAEFGEALKYADILGLHDILSDKQCQDKMLRYECANILIRLKEMMS